MSPAAAVPAPAERRLQIALLALTGVTGVIDAASFLGMGRIFAANMTGNVVFLGFALAGAPGLSMSRCATALVAFAAGAVVGGRLMAAVPPAARSRRAALAWMAEALLLAGAGAVALAVPPDSGDAVAPVAVLALAAIGMGIRNASVRALGVADMTTTVLTLTITGLAADSGLAGGDNPRWPRRIASVVAMGSGAALGVFLLSHGLAATLFFSAVVVGMAAFALRFQPADREQRS